jgi:hypothetical protein
MISEISEERAAEDRWHNLERAVTSTGDSRREAVKVCVDRLQGKPPVDLTELIAERSAEAGVEDEDEARDMAGCNVSTGVERKEAFVPQLEHPGRGRNPAGEKTRCYAIYR